ncbi:MAG TPA: carbohydrate kinase [Candidatus Dormibacteraeota bacterium]|nr:carbohydrate kinase [Candidatus Dormibacteraeota bacterium]
MILSCGEALVDLVPVAVEGEVAFLPRLGGSPYNVAIGLARLGVDAGYLGRVSRDRFGRQLLDRLSAEGVERRHVVEGDEPTTLAVVHLGERGEPDFAFYGEGTADRLLAPGDLPDLNKDITTLHLGSISLVREPGASTYEALMRREHRRRVLSLDPNVRASLIPDHDAYLARLEAWVSLVDLVKLSRADLAWLYPDADPVDAARRWLGLGPAVVVVTLGADGSAALTASGDVEVAGVAVDVVDTVGAGDAFTAALLAWLDERRRLTRSGLLALGRDELAACLAFAGRGAALTCTRAGAEPPTRPELEGMAAV